MQDPTDPTLWTADLAINDGVEGDVTVSVADDSYTDVADNLGSGNSDNTAVDTNAPNTPTILITDDGLPGDTWLNQNEINANGSGIQVQANVDDADLVAGGYVSITTLINGSTITFELQLENGQLVNLDGTPPGIDFSYNNGVITWSEDVPAEGQTITVSISQTDAAGNESTLVSDTATINTVDAVDDAVGTTFSTTADSSNGWVSSVNSNGEADFVISARNADGSTGTLTYNDGTNQLGVGGSPRSTDQVENQIEYDSATGTSEAIVIDFNGLVNEATFSVSRMFADENSGEQGTWYAYYNGQLVATETFSTTSGTTGTFTINTGSLVFDQLVFEAAPTISEANGGPQLTDSSDYYLDSVTVTGPALVDAYVVNENATLSITEISEGLLANDIDAQGHTFTISHVNGDNLVDGEVITLPSGALLTINSDGTYSYNANNAFRNLSAGEVTTDSFTYTITDEYGAIDTATVTINVIGLDEDVIINTPDVLLVDESALADGTGFVNNGQTLASGSTNIEVNDGLDRLEIRNGLNTTTLTLASLLVASAANPIVIAGEYGTLTITGYNDGLLDYNYSINSAQNHTGSNSESLSDNFQITAYDIDGDSASATLSAGINDDFSKATNDNVTIEVLEDSFAIIGGVQATWLSTIGGANIVRYDGDIGNGGEDNDSEFDQIRWGNPVTAGLKSGYGFIDNDTALNGELALNQDIVLGTFTHYNYPIYSGSSITGASMDVVFNVIDAFGVVTPVTLTLNLAHNETPNNGPNPDDIVTIEQTNVTFNYEGELYTIQVIGFIDENGDVVTSIYTEENAATSYDLVIRMVAGNGYELPYIEGNVIDNDITGADVDTVVVGVETGDQSDTSIVGNIGAVITGTYGNLVINTDGSYRYDVTMDNNLIPDNAVETFTYTIRDSDGDESSATLSIDVSLVNVQGVPTSTSDNLNVEGSNLADEIIVLDGENGTQKQLNVSFGGGLFGQITNSDGNLITDNGSNLTSFNQNNKQIISSSEGHDHIETGKGNDTIYAGATGSTNYQSDDELELTSEEIDTHHIMTGTLSGADSIIDTNGLLLTEDVTSAQVDAVNGGSGNDSIFGQSGSDILYGHTGDDNIDGGSHNDGLRGGEGNDTLIGGLGDDIMRGDSGNDTFVWQQGEFGADHITDFNVSEDKLDLSDILVNEEYSSLEDLLNITEANGSTTISIDANGDDVFEQQIILDGIELSSIYSSNEDGVIINGLINDGALIVDTTNEAPAPNTIIDPLDNNPDGNIIP